MKAFLQNPIKRKQYLLLTVDGLIVFSVFTFAYIFRIVIYEGGSIAQLGERLSWLVWVAILVHLALFYVFELYNIENERPRRKPLLIMISLPVLVSVGLIAVLSYIFPQARMGRVLVGIHLPLLIISIFLWRIFFLTVIINNPLKNNLLLIGSTPPAEKFVGLLNEYPMTGYNFSCAITDYKMNPGVAGMEGSQHNMDLLSFVNKNDIRTIIIGERLKGLQELRKQLMNLRFKGVVIFDYHRFYEQLTGKVHIHNINESRFIFSNQGMSFNPSYYRNVKRMTDVVLAAFGIVVSLPLFLIIPLSIKLTSRGPVIFKQERLGMNEKPFSLLKFRTMIDKAEAATGPVWAKKNDPRVTRLGRLLRKTRIDEIPQLLNVLKGEISFIGPRPIRKVFEDEFEKEIPFYYLRHLVKPGITGWAQVNFNNERAENGPLERFKYDLFYIENSSIFLDVFIILKTIQTVLRRPSR